MQSTQPTHSKHVKILFLALGMLALPLAASATNFNNPLGSQTFETILARIAIFLLGLTSALAIVAIIYGGVRLIIGSFESEQEAARAKKIILWALIGLTVAWLSWAIIRFFVVNIIAP